LKLPGVRFQRGDTIVDVGLAAFTASPAELLAAYVNQVLVPSAQDVQVSAPETGVAGNGKPTARASFTGTFPDTGATEGEISTQVTPGGIGIVVAAHAPQGRLAGSIDDVHQFVDTIEVR
jgi:hypothetical protein